MFIKTIHVFTLIFIVTTFSVKSYAEETWKITSLNWEPYSGAELTNEGNSIQKLRELLKKAGIKLIVEFYPWKRSQEKAKTNEYVGYFPAWPEEVYEGFIASPPVDWSEVGILKQSKSSINFESIDDLFKKYRVGIVSTYTYPKVINDAMQKYPAHVDGTMNEKSLLKKLSVGRHPVAITDPNVMQYLAEREGISNINSVKIIMKKELVIAFRDGEDNKQRLNLLKNLLKDM
ncbi:MAG: transporter substrate-binding domain-containing protein [Deltaproteobacteria bacterium]|nr:transporter substrate-binding domain-containing protein [Deltaproteobacteria bacterium]